MKYSLVLLMGLFVPAALGQEKPHKLRWYGQSFFVWELPGGKKIAFDPHAIPEFGRPVLSADLIICSHRHDDHAQPEVLENHTAARLFHGLKEPVKMKPAEWNPIDERVGNIKIRNVPTFHDEENGLRRGKNSCFVLEAEGLTLCHLGDLGHDLNAQQVKQIGAVDVLLIPVGGIYTINGEVAKKVVNNIKPRLAVVPMHHGVPGYDDLLPADEFLEGLANVKKTPNTNELKLNPADKPAAPIIAVMSPKEPEKK
jgi:L-ascorbate metabolism protein UlaG (beta-lactamase superfamily)